MNNIKCILLDIDNTLTNRNEEISNKTAEYFSRINKDYLVVLVTGRTNTYAVEKSKKCNASKIVISDNGAVIYNYETDEVLYNKFFNKEIINKIWDISQKYNIDCVFNTLYKRYRHNRFMNENYIRKNNIGINNLSEINNEVSQIVLLSNEENEYLNCIDEIAKIDDIEICNKGRESDGRFFADINTIGTSKGNAIIQLYKIFNIEKQNSICFGDSGNDRSMFENSGLKVAMKNATEDIKSIANYITEYSNNEDGVIKFLEKYL